MVSKSVRIPIKAFQKFAVQNYNSQVENLRLRRSKVFNKTEMKIRIFCMESHKSYDEISKEVGKDSEYVKKVVDKMRDKGVLSSLPTFRDGKPTELFETIIIEDLKEYGIDRFPCFLQGVRTTEPMFRNFLHTQSVIFAKKVNEKPENPV